ncbi:MAG: hypothetical protein OXF27_08250 [Acidobacteria bacterium]|nr:hypothetical protein [Acidobacteriota bacterium]
MSGLPLFGGELEAETHEAAAAAPARQECFADVLDVPQARPETQEERDAVVAQANKAARKALRAAREGRISVEEYAAVERVAGRAQWEAAVGAFEGKAFELE